MSVMAEPTSSSSDGTLSEKAMQQEVDREAEQAPVVAAAPNPRDFAAWKWKGTVAVIFITSVINGKLYFTEPMSILQVSTRERQSGRDKTRGDDKHHRNSFIILLRHVR